MRFPLSFQQRVMFAAGLVGSLVISVTGQSVTTNIADIQGGMGLTADEGSWLVTIYLVGSLAGVVAFAPAMKAFGLRRLYAVCALVFGMAAVGCVVSTNFETIVTLRGLQGFASGFFGPIAFAVTFVVMGNARLSAGLTLLGFVLVLPATLAPLLSTYLQDYGGWQLLLVVQAATGLAMAVAALTAFPAQPVSWQALKADWVGILLLIVALGGLTVFLSQGTRQFWLESRTIAFALICAISGTLGFLVVIRLSRAPFVLASPFLRCDFALPIGLNLIFRGGLVATGFLVPQFFAIVQGYRPENISEIFAWAVLSQLLGLPLAWCAHRWISGRAIAAFGLLLCGVSVLAVAQGTVLTAREDFLLFAIFFSLGQVFFLLADLRIGGSRLAMPELPTASIAFNASSVVGTTLGIALASHAVTEAEKLYSNGIVEHLTVYNSLVSDRLASLSAVLSSRLADEDLSIAGGVSLLGAAARKQAWVLAFNDCFLAVGIILVGAALVALALPGNPPHKTKQQGSVT